MSNTGMGNRTVGRMIQEPNDADIIIAATDGGIYKSTDMCENWTFTQGGNFKYVVFKPDNYDIVYAGTDDGIYKSEDGGSSWKQKGLAGAKWVNTIAIDPLNPDILYAGTGKPLSSYTGEIVGIFKSTDGGETWQEKHSEKNIDAVAAILNDTDNSSYIYAATYGELWKSTDGGETWVKRDILDPYRNEMVA